MMPPDPSISSWRHCLARLSEHQDHTCPLKKLDHCFLGPFPILEKVSLHVFQLSLFLALSCIHLVFHVSLLQPFSPSEIPNRAIDPPPLIELDHLDEWEIHWILDSRF